MNKSINTNQMIDIVSNMADIIIENEVYFCELDSVAGDGDFGMSIAKGFNQLKKEWDELSKDTIGSFLKDSGMIITEYCGGASGPIWGSAFRGAAKATKNLEEISLSEFADMMQSAVDAIQKRGNAKLGDKTLLDALIPTTESLKESAKKDLSFEEALELGANEAVKGAENTKKMVASKGRASYVGERSLDHPDAGAMALGIIFTSIAKNFKK